MATRPTILIVEDDQYMRESIEDLLAAEGYQVYTAENGEEGLRVLHQIPHPSLVLLDLAMPVMSGEEFLKEVRADVRVACIPVVIMTGKPDLPDRAEEVIRKPLDMNLLLQMVRFYTPSD